MLVENEFDSRSVGEKRMNDDHQRLPIEREAPELEARRQHGIAALYVVHRAVGSDSNRGIVMGPRRGGVDHLELRRPDLPDVVASLIGVGTFRRECEPWS